LADSGVPIRPIKYQPVSGCITIVGVVNTQSAITT
jgi:hypothetical protein